mmetsp:Transcript_63319/g.145617  ORF Transcript_63319/g.145617 Transcript_63319/m.145617 type:complete len:255 (+) Transcript_63319:480-1244(+)
MGAMIPLVMQLTETEGGIAFPVGYALLVLLTTFVGAISPTLKELTFKAFRAKVASDTEEGLSAPSMSMQQPGTSVSPLMNEEVNGHQEWAMPSAELDIFAVASVAAVFQLIWTPIVLPIERAIAGRSAPFGDAFSCLANRAPNDEQGPVCEGAWEMYLLYMFCNALFNLSIYFTMMKESAIFAYLGIKCTLPLSTVLYAFNWPLIGATPLNGVIFISVILVISGTVVFRTGTRVKGIVQQHYPGSTTCCWPLFG